MYTDKNYHRPSDEYDATWTMKALLKTLNYFSRWVNAWLLQKNGRNGKKVLNLKPYEKNH